MECITEAHSAEGRSITRVCIGHGPVSVLLWSQMHGNEPTATMALCDIMQFLTASDAFNDVRHRWLSKLTLHIVPMLNPDAAERYERCTPEGIDLNRDARRRQRPESELLKHLQERLLPDVAFNLHDQNAFYAVGDTGVPAALALMAPPADVQAGVTPVRRRAMQLAVRLRAMLEAGLPGRISAWDDGFEPRAFGDNMQRWGSSTVLVESGTLPGDTEKQQVRHWTALTLLQAFEELSTGSWQGADERAYQAIPPNRSTLYSVLLKGVRIKGSMQREFRVDVGCRRYEVPDRTDGFFVRSEVDQIGDLDGYFGYEEIDASHWTLRAPELVGEHEWTQAGLPDLRTAASRMSHLWNAGRRGTASVPTGREAASVLTGRGTASVLTGRETASVPTEQGTASVPTEHSALSALQTWLERGVGGVRLAHPPEENYTAFPLNLVGPSCRALPPLVPGSPANFCFEQDGKVVCSVVNGFVWRVNSAGELMVPEGASGMVFR